MPRERITYPEPIGVVAPTDDGGPGHDGTIEFPIYNGFGFSVHLRPVEGDALIQRRRMTLSDFGTLYQAEGSTAAYEFLRAIVPGVDALHWDRQIEPALSAGICPKVTVRLAAVFRVVTPRVQWTMDDLTKAVAALCKVLSLQVATPDEMEHFSDVMTGNGCVRVKWTTEELPRYNEPW